MRADEIKLDHLPYKYPTRSAVTLKAEIWQIEECMRQGFPRLKMEPLKDETLCVVGYGPSLEDTWSEITHPCVTVSGAHDFLVSRGFNPDFHVECDGRDHKTKHLENPTDETTYLIASICNPKMWEQLRGKKVEIWHNANGQHVVEWIGKNDPGGILVAGGSVVGLSAIHILGIKGYRRFRCFGFDGNFRLGKRHAGEHYGPPQRLMERNGWKTTPQMSNACDEFINLSQNEEISLEVVGKSLLADLMQVTRWR
jgi:hypothetical protein